MKYQSIFLNILIFLSISTNAQITLSADGPGNTYELINSVLANARRNIVEVPDCNH